MRHGKKFPHLGRKRGHRKYMLANMACSLIEHKSINTTLTKAKALKIGRASCRERVGAVV